MFVTSPYWHEHTYSQFRTLPYYFQVVLFLPQILLIARILFPFHNIEMGSYLTRNHGAPCFEPGVQPLEYFQSSSSTVLNFSSSFLLSHENIPTLYHLDLRFHFLTLKYFKHFIKYSVPKKWARYEHLLNGSYASRRHKLSYSSQIIIFKIFFPSYLEIFEASSNQYFHPLIFS